MSRILGNTAQKLRRILRNTPQRAAGRFRIGHAPVQRRFLELPAPGGVFLANQLHGGAADLDAVAPAKARRVLLQVAGAQPLLTLANVAAGQLVKVVPDLIEELQ